ncbi:MAG: hypothetical protein AAF495_21085 [Pseudomonadota bacterium]
MKRELDPVWSKSQIKAGQKMSEAWEAFFSAAEEQGGGGGKAAAGLEGNAKADLTARRHETELFGYPNVVGVASGQRVRRGQPIGEPCVTVYVERKLPESQLAAKDILPKEIGGLPVDVVEVGQLGAL